MAEEDDMIAMAHTLTISHILPLIFTEFSFCCDARISRDAAIAGVRNGPVTIS
jgi:hypothetical protein